MSLRREGVEQLHDIRSTNTNSVSRARDETQLHSTGGVVGREKLFVPVGIDGDFGKQRRATIYQACTRVAGVEYFNRNVLHAGPALRQVTRDSWRCIGAD